MEVIIGLIVVAGVVWACNKLEQFVLRSRSPVVHGAVRVVGTLAAASLAKDVIRDVVNHPGRGRNDKS